MEFLIPSLRFAALLFLGAALADWLGRSKGWVTLGDSSRWGLRLGWVVLTATLAGFGLAGFGSSAGILGWIAWGTAGLALFLDLTFGHRLPSWLVGIVAGAAVGFASTLNFVPGDTQPWITLHIASAILAYCLLTAQGVNAAVYLLQDRALVKRNFGGIYAFLPPLVPLDRIGHQLLGAAVWMLGLALVIGVVGNMQGLPVSPVKLGASALTWGAASMVLLFKRRGTLSGAAFARACLGILIPALLALFVSLPR